MAPHHHDGWPDDGDKKEFFDNMVDVLALVKATSILDIDSTVKIMDTYSCCPRHLQLFAQAIVAFSLTILSDLCVHHEESVEDFLQTRSLELARARLEFE